MQLVFVLLHQALDLLKMMPEVAILVNAILDIAVDHLFCMYLHVLGTLQCGAK